MAIKSIDYFKECVFCFNMLLLYWHKYLYFTHKQPCEILSIKMLQHNWYGATTITSDRCSLLEAKPHTMYLYSSLRSPKIISEESQQQLDWHDHQWSFHSHWSSSVLFSYTPSSRKQEMCTKARASEGIGWLCVGASGDQTLQISTIYDIRKYLEFPITIVIFNIYKYLNKYLFG